jgi:hypothetical protein
VHAEGHEGLATTISFHPNFIVTGVHESPAGVTVYALEPRHRDQSSDQPGYTRPDVPVAQDRPAWIDAVDQTSRVLLAGVAVASGVKSVL